MNMSMSWVDLPDALWHEILRFSTVQDLVQMEQVCWKFNTCMNINMNIHLEHKEHQGQISSIHDLWKTHCQNRWNDKPRYKLTEEREAWLRRHYHGGINTTPTQGNYNDNDNDKDESTNTCTLSESDACTLGGAPLATHSSSSTTGTSITSQTH
mmetsp:Transcript_8940/g.21271  ORF Transcript_8940/g.21271 Transcript_8940/m.21271 type:complete len:154 (-) Transcript_8940:110-571(-)